MSCACGQHRRAREQARDEEEDGQERVAAEDVAHRELVVADPHRLDAGRDLGQRRRAREERRAEHHAGHAEVAGDALAALLERDAAGERDDGGDARTRAPSASVDGAGVLSWPSSASSAPRWPSGRARPASCHGRPRCARWRRKSPASQTRDDQQRRRLDPSLRQAAGSCVPPIATTRTATTRPHSSTRTSDAAR